MAAPSSSAASHDLVCPDPSKHSELAKEPALQDQASKAALLATSSPEKAGTKRNSGISALGSDGKLSAAGAATSLKYAKPQDLPGFPSVGIAPASGQKAATLANQNQSSFEHWKPDASSSASKAALMAHKDGGKLDLWQPEASKTGFSAASMAMNKDHNLSPQLDYGYTDAGKRNSLLAATKSISGSKNKPPPPPPSSQPPTYPDQHNSAYNALNAATVANRPSTRDSGDGWGSSAMEASRVKNHHMSREMFTEHPPVAPEVEEKRHQEALKASAVVMARQMMESQKRQSTEVGSDAGDIAARSVHNKHLSQSTVASEDYKAEAAKYVNLQEAARKLAAERLAKLDPDGVAAYREHYGYSLQQPGTRNRLTMRGRRREEEEDDDGFSSDDEVRAGRIRNQMRGLNKDVSSVDEKKRQTDRSNLIAAAQKRVSARMLDMDEKVFAETGQVSPAMMAEWEVKAKAKAAADSEQRMANHGKVHIGGGKYMDQSEIDAIAAARMQPTLDEINDTAEKKRARDEEIRLDQERRAFEAQQEKQRLAEEKAEIKQNERNEKFRIANEKRMAKDAEKERKRQEKANKIIIVPKGESPLITAPVAADLIPNQPHVTTGVIGETQDKPETEVDEDAIESVTQTRDVEETPGDGLLIPAQETATRVGNEPFTTEDATETTPATAVATTTTGTSPAKRESKVKSFFGKLRSTKNPSTGTAPETPSATMNPVTGEKSPIMAGALTDKKDEESSDLYESSEKNVPVATEPEPQTVEKSPSPSISSGELVEAEPDTVPETSSPVEAAPSTAVEETAGDAKVSASNDEFEEARDTFDDKLEPPKSSLADIEGSPSRSASKFHEDVE